MASASKLDLKLNALLRLLVQENLVDCRNNRDQCHKKVIDVRFGRYDSDDRERIEFFLTFQLLCADVRDIDEVAHVFCKVLLELKPKYLRYFPAYLSVKKTCALLREQTFHIVQENLILPLVFFHRSQVSFLTIALASYFQLHRIHLGRAFE